MGKESFVMDNEESLKHTYELTLLLSPDLSEFDLQKSVDKVKSAVEKQGSMIQDYSWGKKQLAYPIGEAEFGYYHTMVFSLPADAVSAIVKDLELAPEVIRHLLISLDKEGITPEQLFSPEKEEAMLSSSVSQKMAPEKPALAPKKKPVAPKTEPPAEKSTEKAEKADEADDDTRRKELDKKIDELLKKDETE